MVSSDLVHDAGDVVETPRRCRVAHAWLTAEMYEGLESDAERRGVHVDQLVAAIVISIVGRDLVDKLLGR